MSRDNSTVRTRFLPDSRFTLTNYRFRGGKITHTHTHCAEAAEEAKTKFNTCNNSIDGVGHTKRERPLNLEITKRSRAVNYACGVVFNETLQRASVIHNIDVIT